MIEMKYLLISMFFLMYFPLDLLHFRTLSDILELPNHFNRQQDTLKVAQ